MKSHSDVRSVNFERNFILPCNCGLCLCHILHHLTRCSWTETSEKRCHLFEKTLQRAVITATSTTQLNHLVQIRCDKTKKTRHQNQIHQTVWNDHMCMLSLWKCAVWNPKVWVSTHIATQHRLGLSKGYASVHQFKFAAALSMASNICPTVARGAFQLTRTSKTLHDNESDSVAVQCATPRHAPRCLLLHPSRIGK